MQESDQQKPLIEVDHLCKQYGDFNAVNDLSFRVFSGDVFAFLGPNGAGKSTTLRMLTSLVRPTSGHVFYFGLNLNEHRTAILKKTGSIVEKPDFYRFLSAEKNLEIFAKLSGRTISRPDIYQTLEWVGLNGREKDKVKTYSHGMKQRLGIAVALIHDPEIILLDEPVNGMDPEGIIDIRNMIRFLNTEKKKTILLSSHLLSEVEQIASRMIIIDRGKLVVEGEVSKLLNSDELIVSVRTTNPQQVKNEINGTKWMQKLSSAGGMNAVFNLRETEIPELNRFLCDHSVDVLSIESKRKLEDYYLKLISGKN